MDEQKKYYKVMREELNERQWRMFLGMQAKQDGYGGISEVCRLSEASWKTVKRGILDLEDEKRLPKNRIRLAGGGRKKIVDKDGTLLSDLEKLTNPKGDPMTFLKYTTKSLNHLTIALKERGHEIKKSTLANLLNDLKYSLTPNKKNIEGKSHKDRDAQFQHINEQCALFEKNNNPIISIDCKKKEQIGNFKNNGKEWTKRGEAKQVNAYDFRSLAKGLAIPYGVYDKLKKQGFVNVGISHDTAQFAVESIRRWWNKYGKKIYKNPTGLLITADGGGSNGVRNNLFKYELQQFVNQIKLPITLCHLPPATSKWNVIEHQLFSFISINWRAVPLTSLSLIIRLISHTKTKSGLTVSAIKDMSHYQTGIKISNEELSSINIVRDQFHGEWNYTIYPQIN